MILKRALPFPFTFPLIPRTEILLYLVLNGIGQITVIFLMAYILCNLDSLFIFLLNYLISQFYLIKKCLTFFEEHFELFDTHTRIKFLKQLVDIHNSAIEYESYFIYIN